MLFVVATPIGNLEDITLRALRILKEVDLIAAEDTRHTKKLLNKYSISTPLVSFHQHSSDAKAHQIVEKLKTGAQVALVTDAGTPGISDPGGVLVKAAQAADIKIIPVPGPSAITAVLSAAGIPADSFLFMGFLPKKKGRTTLWREMKGLDVPIVLYESPNRVVKTLQEIVEHLGDREVIIGRELTKIHEEILKDTAQNLLKHFTARSPKGEFVIVIT